MMIRTSIYAMLLLALPIASTWGSTNDWVNELEGTYSLRVRQMPQFPIKHRSVLDLRTLGNANVHIRRTARGLDIIYQTISGNLTTNQIELGSLSSWQFQGHDLVGVSNVMAKGYMLPGSTRQTMETRLSRDKDGTIMITSSFAESGKAFWFIPWKDEVDEARFQLLPVPQGLEGKH